MACVGIHTALSGAPDFAPQPLSASRMSFGSPEMSAGLPAAFKRVMPGPDGGRWIRSKLVLIVSASPVFAEISTPSALATVVLDKMELVALTAAIVCTEYEGPNVVQPALSKYAPAPPMAVALNAIVLL